MKGEDEIVIISSEIYKLYGIIGSYRSGDIDEYIKSICSKTLAAIKGGMTFLQLREKHMSIGDEVRLARAVKEVCYRYRVPLIINDSVDVCVLAEADGVHLGQQDGSILEARKLLGRDKIIGGTAHNLAEAIRAEKEGANYLGLGAAFGSNTKADAVKINLDDYNEITSKVRIPVVAIGGINSENLYLLKGRGLAGVAVISAIFEGKDIKSDTSRLKRMLNDW